jgi:hypothetical protein
LAERVKALEAGLTLDRVISTLQRHYVERLAAAPAVERVLLDPTDGEYRVVTFLRGADRDDANVVFGAEYEFLGVCPDYPVEFVLVLQAERPRTGLVGPAAITLYERE